MADPRRAPHAPGARLREILRAADRAAGAYLMHHAIEDALHTSGALRPGDYLIGTRTDDGGNAVADCVRANGDEESVALTGGVAMTEQADLSTSASERGTAPVNDRVPLPTAESSRVDELHERGSRFRQAAADVEYLMTRARQEGSWQLGRIDGDISAVIAGAAVLLAPPTHGGGSITAAATTKRTMPRETLLVSIEFSDSMIAVTWESEGDELAPELLRIDDAVTSELLMLAAVPPRSRSRVEFDRATLTFSPTERHWRVSLLRMRTP